MKSSADNLERSLLPVEGTETAPTGRMRVEGGWSGSGCSIVAGAGGLVGAPRQGSTNGSLHTRASAHLLSQGGTFGTSWASG